jgi:SAM-dependent methyltransferase
VSETFYKSYAEKTLTAPGAARRGRIEESRLAFLHARRAPPGDMLEIGPGQGTLADRAVASGWHYTAIEPSPDLAGRLSRQGRTVIQAWTPPFPVRDTCCDVVYADQVLEHMPGIDAARMFVREMRRVLRPDGVALVVVPDYAKEGWFFWDIDYTHNFVTTERRMRQLFNDGGFDVQGMTRTIGAATGPARAALAGAAVLANLPGTDALAGLLRQEDLLFKVRKNLFQTMTFVVRRA